MSVYVVVCECVCVYVCVCLHVHVCVPPSVWILKSSKVGVTIFHWFRVFWLLFKNILLVTETIQPNCHPR